MPPYNTVRFNLSTASFSPVEVPKAPPGIIGLWSEFIIWLAFLLSISEATAASLGSFIVVMAEVRILEDGRDDFLTAEPGRMV